MNDYTAKPNKLSPKVRELMEQWNGTNSRGIRTKLNKIIKEDRYVIDAYNLRFEIFKHEDFTTAMYKEAVRGYKIALELIQDDNGEFPDRLEWGWLENRPILRALLNYAFVQWITLKWDEAEAVMGRMVMMNPFDNQGIRFFYLAVLERITWAHFRKRFPEGEPEKLYDWFERESKKYEQFKENME